MTAGPALLLWALLALSGTLESFASAGQMVGKVLVGYIESRTLLGAQVMGLIGGVVGLAIMWWAPKLMGEAGIWPMFFGGAAYGLMYACSTAMLPFFVREVFGGRDYDRIYSWQVVVFNGFGAMGATAWAVLARRSCGCRCFFCREHSCCRGHVHHSCVYGHSGLQSTCEDMVQIRQAAC